MVASWRAGTLTTPAESRRPHTVKASAHRAQSERLETATYIFVRAKREASSGQNEPPRWSRRRLKRATLASASGPDLDGHGDLWRARIAPDVKHMRSPGRVERFPRSRDPKAIEGHRLYLGFDRAPVGVAPVIGVCGSLARAADTAPRSVADVVGFADSRVVPS